MGVLPRNSGAIHFEVSAPAIRARVEESDDLACLGIEAGDVWSLVPVAVSAGKCQIFLAGCAPVLPGNHVVDLKGQGKP
jgi:hypothetical protein